MLRHTQTNMNAQAAARLLTVSAPKHANPALDREGETSPSSVDDEDDIPETEPLPHEITDNPELRCKYSSKFCNRKRTIKRGGMLHKFCEFHRQKANRNQRRLESRKRVRREQAEATQRAMEAYDAHYRPPVSVPSQVPIAKQAQFSWIPATHQHVVNMPAVHFESPRQVDEVYAYEPCVEPVELEAEDLEAVRFLVEDESTSCVPDHVAVTSIEVCYPAPFPMEL
ncbi:TPA: hypothetical protein N0F65_005709 [Lagenidium giganteum]|uniref:Uncharacterized protein n=1 Tax=Lagenidium giganteum TaxID=4803 RepID=A0AAV2ZCR8_9STRA|nr:TPA: hypothetical protein N0F65_005709 [Lagenidium giganteum]